MTTETCHRIACLGTALCAGSVGLALELLVAGWLAPVFGGGLEVWAAVLGTTLAAMAVGYFAGAMTTGRAGPRSLPALLGAAGLAVLLTARLGPGLPPDAGLLSSCVLLLGPPLLLLSAGTPWLVELLARTGVGPGRAAGLVYAVSTVGGVAGALGAGLSLMPWLGLRRTAGAVALALVAALLVWAAAGRGGRLVAGGMAALLGALVAAGWPAPDDGVVDSWYGRHEVHDDGVVRTLLVDGVPQSRQPSLGMAPQAGDLLRAGNPLELLPLLRPDGERALVVGLGGGVLPSQLALYGWEVVSVEIDPDVVRLARSHFGYDGECRIADGRRALAAPGEYDAVVLDVYRGARLPPQLFSVEAMRRVRERVGPTGLLAVNLIGAPGDDATCAILRTVGEVFGHRMLLASASDDMLSPMTLLASDAPIEDETTADRLAVRRWRMPPAVDLDQLPLDSAERLTDDRNPLPRLRLPTARAWRALALRRDR